MIRDQYLKNACALFIVCGTSLTVSADETPQSQNQSPQAQQVAPAAAELEAILKNTDLIRIEVKSIISHAISNLRKYGKNIENKNEVIQQLLDAGEAVDALYHIKTRSIQQYYQQTINTIPTDAYPEIYGIHDKFLEHVARFLEVLSTYIRSNFKEPFDYNFLINKDHWLLDEQIEVAVVINRCADALKKAAAAHHSSNQIGLTRWNKVARTIDRYLWQPCARYHIPEVALIGGFATFATLYILWMTLCERHLTKTENVEFDARLEQLSQMLDDNNNNSFS